jgi:hypothetical protein
LAPPGAALALFFESCFVAIGSVSSLGAASAR